jgi:hypothetical protein
MINNAPMPSGGETCPVLQYRNMGAGNDSTKNLKRRMKMKVENMTSNNSGREVANQFIIRDGKVVYFQSYNSIIVREDDTHYPPEITLDAHYWNYSKTTGRYRNQFLGETTKETERKIKDGTYKLADLNGDAR